MIFLIKAKMYSILADDSSEHEKSKGVNKSVVPRKITSECKNALLNIKCLRHLMNRIQRKNQEIGN